MRGNNFDIYIPANHQGIDDIEDEMELLEEKDQDEDYQAFIDKLIESE